MPATTAEAGLNGDLDVLIIGAGFAGLAMGRQLKRAGVERFAIVDRADGVGGVWRANHYPGAACDVPSHLYSYSFFLNPDWSRKFSPQSEILAYLERAADAFGLREHLTFERTVQAMTFNAEAGRWTVRFSDGASVTARAVISAVGQLSEPFTPKIDGLDSFQGPVLHSAEWDDSVVFSGKRVAVIGNAASAVQLLPRLTAETEHLTVLARTPNWVIPKPDRAFLGIEKWAFRHIPGWHRLYRTVSYLIHELRYPAFVSRSLASAYTHWRLKTRIQKAVKDEKLRARLTPDYPPGCKRILLSNDYLQLVQREDVRLIADRPVRINANTLITGSGEEIEADILVFATGFQTTDFLPTLQVENAEGRTLREVWGVSPRAYRGVAVSDFPNLFMLYGPNTNLGHNSIIFMLERQTEYVRRQVKRLLDEDISALSISPEAETAFNAKLQARLQRTVWAEDCPSWYKTEDGVITNNWSGLATAFAMTLGSDDRESWVVR
jgi:cation diffusion facilitator CzcD-associated flavoprotein CzcO